MKRTFVTLFLCAMLMIGLSTKVKSQTAGTLTFTFTQSAPTTQATKNVMAVWIEDGSGVFVKTKMRYWSSGTSDHLPSWKTNSAQSVVDAATGATRTASTSPTAFGAKTITWDGTNVSAAVVADGTYNIYIESSYCNPEPSSNQHWVITNFAFTKGPTAVHLTPTGPTNFSNITLDWVPAVATSPVVTTGTTTTITQTTATCSGNVTSDGGSAITERGVCYDVNANPQTTNTHVTATGTTGAYTCNLMGLVANTTYHVRAYAVNSIGTTYGVDSSFKTQCVKPTKPVITQTGNTLNSNTATGNQWYNTTSGAITGATNQTYNPTANASYYVTVTANSCMSDPSNTIAYSTVGVQAYDNNRTINVYPNPVSNELVIEITGNKDKQAYEIYNSIGQVVYKGYLIEKTTVQTTDFSSGVYMIKLENGKTFEFKKILKK